MINIPGNQSIQQLLVKKTDHDFFLKNHNDEKKQH